MKIKKFSILIILFFMLFSLTGCGAKNPIDSDDGIKNYLKENFPNEEFTIEDKEKIDIEKLGTGYSYTIKSNTTGIEFNVKNHREENYFGSSYYAISCNYFEKAFEKYYSEYENENLKNKIKFRYNSDNEIVLDLSVTDFDSLDEIPKQSYNLFDYINKKTPFTNYKEGYHFLTILIFDENNYPCNHISYDTKLDSSELINARFKSNMFQYYISNYIKNYDDSDFSKNADLYVDYQDSFYKVNFNIRLDISKFKSNTELANKIYQFKNYIYNKDFKFSNYEPDLSIVITIKDGTNTITSFNLKDINSENDISKLL